MVSEERDLLNMVMGMAMDMGMAMVIRRMREMKRGGGRFLEVIKEVTNKSGKLHLTDGKVL